MQNQVVLIPWDDFEKRMQENSSDQYVILQLENALFRHIIDVEGNRCLFASPDVAEELGQYFALEVQALYSACVECSASVESSDGDAADRYSIASDDEENFVEDDKENLVETVFYLGVPSATSVNPVHIEWCFQYGNLKPLELACSKAEKQIRASSEGLNAVSRENSGLAVSSEYAEKQHNNFHQSSQSASTYCDTPAPTSCSILSRKNVSESQGFAPSLFDFSRKEENQQKKQSGLSKLAFERSPEEGELVTSCCETPKGVMREGNGLKFFSENANHQQAKRGQLVASAAIESTEQLNSPVERILGTH